MEELLNCLLPSLKKQQGRKWISLRRSIFFNLWELPGLNGQNTRELICLLTTILDPKDAPALVLAQGYHDRWEHETGNDQLKTHLRGPGRVLRSHSPDMVRQEIYGYLLTHYAISALICRAATEADMDPDRVKFLRTVRIVRRRVADPAAFSP